MNAAPYEWPKTSGCLTAGVLIGYHAWLDPKLEIEHRAPGQAETTQKAKANKKITPWLPRKQQGWLNVQRDLRPFAAYVIKRLEPYSHRAPYLPRKRKGMAMVADLQDFHSWVLKTLEHKKQSQQRSKNNPHS